MDNNKILNLIGMAYRAGKVTIGEEKTVYGIRNNKIKLVLLANDTGKNTSKKLRDKSKFYSVLLIDIFNSDEISKSLGKQNIKVIGINDRGFKDAILEKMS